MSPLTWYKNRSRRRGSQFHVDVKPHIYILFGKKMSAWANDEIRSVCSCIEGHNEGDIFHLVVAIFVMSFVFMRVVLVSLLQKNMPKFNKIPFYLQPHSSSGAKTLKK